MLPALIALQILTLIALIALWLRKPASSAANSDPRLDQLLAADLPANLARLDAHFGILSKNLRDDLSQQRMDSEKSASALRSEVLGSMRALGETLHSGLESFRADNSGAADRLRSAVDDQLRTLSDRFTSFSSETARNHAESREALHRSLADLTATEATHQEKLRSTVEARLDALNQSNSAKLDQMRETVDEKLHATLQDRLTKSFGEVTDQLTKVHAGLGEMTRLSAGVDDLSRIFTNVKTRGTIGEVMLETLLKQMLPPNQYLRNARIKPNTKEQVEFAIKMPTAEGEVLLPIDSKFPREIGERLETAYETGTGIDAAAKVFETAIRNEGKKICEKYIAEPTTTSVAIMFLPTEGLYAEVMRRDGLQSEIQQNCHVIIAGPSTLSAILSSFLMGLHMLQLQQKGSDVWKVLASARKDFGEFGKLMTKMENQVNTVQNTIQDVGKRTRAINKTLSDVGIDSADAALPSPTQAGYDGLLPLLHASESELQASEDD